MHQGETIPAQIGIEAVGECKKNAYKYYILKCRELIELIKCIFVQKQQVHLHPILMNPHKLFILIKDHLQSK